jgi:hypothetical protein
MPYFFLFRNILKIIRKADAELTSKIGTPETPLRYILFSIRTFLPSSPQELF